MPSKRNEKTGKEWWAAVRFGQFFVAVSLAALAACNAAQPSHGTSEPAAAATVAPATAPEKTQRVRLAAATPAASLTPASTATPLSTPSSSPKPRPTFTAPVRLPDAPPRIYSVLLNKNDVGSGDTVWGKVLTSSNVASVEVRVATYGVGLEKVGVGRFTLEYRLGSIPFFVRGTYPMQIIARNTRGDTDVRTVPLTVH